MTRQIQVVLQTEKKKKQYRKKNEKEKKMSRRDKVRSDYVVGRGHGLSERESHSESSAVSKHRHSQQMGLPAGTQLKAQLTPTSRQVTALDIGAMSSFYFSPINADAAIAPVQIFPAPQTTGGSVLPVGVVPSSHLQLGLNMNPVLFCIDNNGSCTTTLKVSVSSDCRPTRELLRDTCTSINICPGPNSIQIPSSQISAALAAGFGASGNPAPIAATPALPSNTMPIELIFNFFTCDGIYILTTKMKVYATFVDYYVATLNVNPQLTPSSAGGYSAAIPATAVLSGAQTPGNLNNPNATKTTISLYTYTYSGVVANNSDFEVRNSRLFWDACIQEWQQSQLKQGKCDDGECKNETDCGCFKELTIDPFVVVDDCGCKVRMPKTFRLTPHNKIFFCVKITSRTIIVAPVLHWTGVLELNHPSCKDIPFHVASPGMGEELLDVQTPSLTGAIPRQGAGVIGAAQDPF
jgi:hypothetical protein